MSGEGRTKCLDCWWTMSLRSPKGRWMGLDMRCWQWLTKPQWEVWLKLGELLSSADIHSCLMLNKKEPQSGFLWCWGVRDSRSVYVWVWPIQEYLFELFHHSDHVLGGPELEPQSGYWLLIFNQILNILSLSSYGHIYFKREKNTKRKQNKKQQLQKTLWRQSLLSATFKIFFWSQETFQRK